jgi:hypothetical protein
MIFCIRIGYMIIIRDKVIAINITNSSGISTDLDSSPGFAFESFPEY